VLLVLGRALSAACVREFSDSFAIVSQSVETERSLPYSSCVLRSSRVAKFIAAWKILLRRALGKRSLTLMLMNVMKIGLHQDNGIETVVISITLWYKLHLLYREPLSGIGIFRYFPIAEINFSGGK